MSAQVARLVPAAGIVGGQLAAVGGWLLSYWRPLTGLALPGPWAALALGSVGLIAAAAWWWAPDGARARGLSIGGWLWLLIPVGWVLVQGPWALVREPGWLDPGTLRYAVHPLLTFTWCVHCTSTSGILLSASRWAELPRLLSFWLGGSALLLWAGLATPPPFLG